MPEILGQGGDGIVRLIETKDGQYACKEMDPQGANAEIAAAQRLGENPYTVHTTAYENDINISKTVFGRSLPFFNEKKGRIYMPVYSDLEKVPLDLHQRQELAIEFLNAVSYIHKKGVIHNDLRPEAIMLDIEGHLRLIDFASSEVWFFAGGNNYYPSETDVVIPDPNLNNFDHFQYDPEQRSYIGSNNSDTVLLTTNRISPNGFAGYFAPERNLFINRQRIHGDPRSDIFSSAATAFAILTGRNLIEPPMELINMRAYDLTAAKNSYIHEFSKLALHNPGETTEPKFLVSRDKDNYLVFNPFRSRHITNTLNPTILEVIQKGAHPKLVRRYQTIDEFRTHLALAFDKAQGNLFVRKQ